LVPKLKTSVRQRRTGRSKTQNVSETKKNKKRRVMAVGVNLENTMKRRPMAACVN
jgi:hypothetical protein